MLLSSPVRFNLGAVLLVVANYFRRVRQAPFLTVRRGAFVCAICGVSPHGGLLLPLVSHRERSFRQNIFGDITLFCLN